MYTIKTVENVRDGHKILKNCICIVSCCIKSFLTLPAEPTRQRLCKPCFWCLMMLGASCVSTSLDETVCWWHFLHLIKPSPVVILLIMHIFFSRLVLAKKWPTWQTHLKNNVHDQKDTKIMIVEGPGWSIYVYLRFSSRWNLLYCGDLLWEGTIDVDTCLVWWILVV